MAKVKTFAVDVEFIVKRTVHVAARRPNGAVDRLKSRDGWAEATRYQEDPVLDGYFELPKDATVVRVREA